MVLRLFELATSSALALTGARRSRHEVAGVSLVTYTQGPRDGEPWVLLHGLGATALGWWRLLRALGRECRVLMPELSALGGTRGPGPGLDVRQGAAAVGDLIRELFPDRKVSIAGMSLGGWMATRLALDQPELVERLILISCAGYRDQNWERIRNLVTIRDGDDLDRLHEAIFHRVPFLARAGRHGYLQAYRSPAVRHILSAIDPEDSFCADDLARLEIPVALVWGEHDGLFTVEVGRTMHAAIGGSELHVIPDGAHALNWERPAALTEAVQAFRRHTRAA